MFLSVSKLEKKSFLWFSRRKGEWSMLWPVVRAICFNSTRPVNHWDWLCTMDKNNISISSRRLYMYAYSMLQLLHYLEIFFHLSQFAISLSTWKVNECLADHALLSQLFYLVWTLNWSKLTKFIKTEFSVGS